MTPFKTYLSIALALTLPWGATGCKNNSVKNKLTTGVPLQPVDDGGGPVNTGTVAARKDETVEQTMKMLQQAGLYGQLTSSFGSSGFLAARPAPGDIAFDAATGFYTMDTGDPNFVFKMRFNNAAGNALQVLTDTSLEAQVKSIRVVTSVASAGDSFSADLTMTFSVLGAADSPVTLSGTIGGTTSVDLEAGSTGSSSFSATFSNFSNDFDAATGQITQNGTMTLTSTYPGGAITETITTTNLAANSAGQFVSGAIAISGQTGGLSFSGTLTYAGGTGTGTFTFGSETFTVSINGDGTGTYTDSTGTHPLSV